MNFLHKFISKYEIKSSSDSQRIEDRAFAIEKEINSGKNPWIKGMNCRLFAQLLMETPSIEKQPKLKTIEPGAILFWGSGGQWAHVAVALDPENVIQIGGWHEQVEKLPLKKVISEWGKKYEIYKPKTSPADLRSAAPA